jgi:hypothetical protein
MWGVNILGMLGTIKGRSAVKQQAHLLKAQPHLLAGATLRRRRPDRCDRDDSALEAFGARVGGEPCRYNIKDVMLRLLRRRDLVE